MRDLVYSNLVVPNSLMQLAYLMYGLLILRSQSILLVNELLVLFMKGDPLLLHFLELDCSRAEVLLEVFLFLLDCPQLVG